MDALKQRQSQLDFSPQALTPQVLAGLLWASTGMATVLRAWIDRVALGGAMGLGADHSLLLAQTVGEAAIPNKAPAQAAQRGRDHRSPSRSKKPWSCRQATAR